MRFVATLAAAAALLAAAPAAEAKTKRLKVFASCSSLISFAQSRASKVQPAYPTGGGRGVPISEGGADGGPVAAQPAPTAPQETAAGTDEQTITNVQEAGVDEPDVVKAHGGTIFAIARGDLYAVTTGGDGPKLAGSLKLSDVGYDSELLVRGDKLLAITRTYQPLEQSAKHLMPYYGDETTVLTEVSIAYPAAMKVIRTDRIGGRYVSARQVGRSARVVVSSRPHAMYELPEAPIRDQPAGWRPSAILERQSTGARKRRGLVTCNHIRRPVQFGGLQMLTVLTIDLDKGLPAVDSDAIMTDGDLVYASTGSLYVATRRWLTPAQESGAANPPDTITAIHRFDISNPDETVYRGSGQVKGYLLNQFSMSEDRGVLRVASTEEPIWWGGAQMRDSESFVTTLDVRDTSLPTLARVEGMGKGERIYAVRFLGDKGYVVTFRQIDPLYTLDLSDPRAPKVAGALKILGYSAYLHPAGEDLLIGVGQDASEAGRRLGAQVSLFDVSDLRHPSRLAAKALGSFSSSQAEYDHHAFLYNDAQKLAVIPLNSYSDTAEGFTGAVGLRMTRAEGINEVGRMVHKPGSYALPIARSFVLGERLYTLSDGGVLASRLSDLHDAGYAAFPAPPPEPEPVGAPGAVEPAPPPPPPPGR